MSKFATWIGTGLLAGVVLLAPTGDDASVATSRAAAIHDAPAIETTTTVITEPESLAPPTNSVSTTSTSTTSTTRPIMATPTQPLQDDQPLAPEGQTVEDATVIADDGFGFPVETGHSEVSRLGETYDVSDLAEFCAEAKPWLCE